MKIPLLCALVLSTCLCMQGQSSADSNFVTMITSANWMPDGQALLLSIVKFDKTRKSPPVSKGFTYHLQRNKLEPLDFEGAGRAASPDGKKLVFVKTKENNKGDIYLFDLAAKMESALVVDTFHKFAPGWSPDGKKIVYNRESNGRGQHSTIEICVVDIATGSVKQITESGKHKSYSPVWAPQGDRIVYYFEKGDNRDQVWLTDAIGSFHRNLTNDTSSHNYYPSWIDENTIAYTRAPNHIMLMNPDGNNRRKLEGIQSFQLKYNPATKQAVYITQRPESKLILFNWKTKTSKVVLEQSALKDLL